MKLFDKAILKLSATYTAILLVISIGFSAAVYGMTNYALFRPRPIEINFTQSDRKVEIERFIHSRNEQVNADLLIQLILINLAVLFASAIASYFLARRTLQPINQAMQAQGRFVSDVSHELRTPLAAIAMENEVTLRDKEVSREDLLTQIQSNVEEVEKLRELTDRLLNLSQNESPEITEVDIQAAAADAITRVKKSAKDKKVTLKNESTSQKIQADLGALTDTLAILLDNAVKYSPEKSTVTIGNNDDKIFVRDQGPGISATDLPHIFERFYRAESSRTSDGHGLGLSLAQNLANQMNMKITVKNNSDQGATFYLS